MPIIPEKGQKRNDSYQLFTNLYQCQYLKRNLNYSQITADVLFLCGTTSASYPLADITRNVNIEYNNISRLIWESQGSWQYDDSNATTLPIAKATMVHGQQDYSLPS